MDIWAPYVDVRFQIWRAGLPAGRVNVFITGTPAPPGPGAEGTALGAIMFVSPGTPGNRIFVSVSGVRQLAMSAAWRGRSLREQPPAVIRTFDEHALARTLAHEIGHYLLRSKAHASVGLMRATFSADELMAGSLAPYGLTTGERLAVAGEFEIRTAQASPQARETSGR